MRIGLPGQAAGVRGPLGPGLAQGPCSLVPQSTEGIGVGADVSCVGARLGTGVICVGAGVGADVGVGVGAGVGADVGADVGAGVGYSKHVPTIEYVP